MQSFFPCGLVICTLSFRAWWYWILIPWVSLCFWFNILWLFSIFFPLSLFPVTPFSTISCSHSISAPVYISSIHIFSLWPFQPLPPHTRSVHPTAFFLSWPSCSQPSTLQRVNGLAVLLKQMSARGQRGDRGHGADKKKNTYKEALNSQCGGWRPGKQPTVVSQLWHPARRIF